MKEARQQGARVRFQRFRDIDVLILPQFSLTTAHAALPKVTGRTDLCASRSAIGLLKRLSA